MLADISATFFLVSWGCKVAFVRSSCDYTFTIQWHFACFVWLSRISKQSVMYSVVFRKSPRRSFCEQVLTHRLKYNRPHTSSKSARTCPATSFCPRGITQVRRTSAVLYERSLTPRRALNIALHLGVSCDWKIHWCYWTHQYRYIQKRYPTGRLWVFCPTTKRSANLGCNNLDTHKGDSWASLRFTPN